nr:DUF3726 domain-containing protein [Marivita sp. S6314]
MNEIDATAKKAARGAGYSWGVAEDTGKALRFLCQNGLDGCGALAAFLVATDGIDKSQLAPERDGDMWRAQGSRLCPITLGITAADRAYQIDDTPFQAADTRYPVLILPFAALVARSLGRCVVVDCDTSRMATDGRLVSVSRSVPETAASVTLSCGDRLGQPNPQFSRAVPKDTDWATLNAFAHRTYAPATEESRLKGAG